MRKHALGFVFFVAIVSLFAAGYTVFRTYSIPEIEVVENANIPARKTVCFPRLRAQDVRVVQAIADLSDSTLVLDLSMPGAFQGRAGSEVAFSFYRVDTNGARLIRSDERLVLPDAANGGAASGIVSYRLDWLGKGEKLDNLYVMARALRPESERGLTVPFSREAATPVVLIAKR